MLGGNARYELSESLKVNAGCLDFPRPWFPLVTERAALVKTLLPSWAIASGPTAGWVWTGMGYPEPWCVLRKRTPALSPISRTAWSARVVRETGHRVVELNGLLLLDRRSAALEVLYSGINIDVAAAQLFFLMEHTPLRMMDREDGGRRTPLERHNAHRVLERMKKLARLYPDITR